MTRRNMLDAPVEALAELAATDPKTDPGAWMRAAADAYREMASAQELTMRAWSRHAETIARTHNARARAAFETLSGAAREMTERRASGQLAQDWADYLRDAAERMALTMDVLRERGDVFIAHEAAGCPPVLVYDYETVMDGADLEHPCNYVLLRILPPDDNGAPLDKRPYVIIDPRAGHGAGIGGFKSDSQVGVALRDGHPVYFVGFKRDPAPGQTLADVTRAEAEFVREVMRRHPDAPNPVVMGNCQGGWATLLLAATNPDITGPIVLNGAPIAPWSGEVGKNPMRYNAGIMGGAWQPMFWSDLGGGIFDGAHLVMNFEMLNPSRNYFRKYYDLYADVDEGKQRFLEFERWWGGFFRLNEAEIRWIVEQLFVGNRIVKNQAMLEPGRVIDVKKIRSPIIVFASHGDNITPPQQALNWIADTYADVDEIRIRGQRIVYMVHEEVGHLGIFVSSSIAKKEHSEVSSTMKTIEQLAPGLYEMKIDAVQGEGLDKRFLVSFEERRLDAIRANDDGREEECAFAAVARLSEAQAEAYDTFMRPFVQAMVNAPMAETVRSAHPMRAQRAAMSSRNPAMSALASWAAAVRAHRSPVGPSNPFRIAEKVAADMIEQNLDFMRDARDAGYETLFHMLWGAPWARAYGKPLAVGRTKKNPAELRALPEVQAAMAHAADGGFVEAVIRMLVLLAESRGNVRRDRLERSAKVLTQDPPFRELPSDERARIIHAQTLIATLDPALALATLPALLRDPESRALAARVVRYVPGAIDEMAPHTFEMLQKFHELLGLPPFAEDVTEDPLDDIDTLGAAAQ
ncbi:MAG: DUF3141 domain-containing protein [Rubrimonas sp.]|uniref:DUF3141 domain-containing protein n=1 Tax=Rubrimonas sp. TaxID=2036015 RepID=UPI002FDEA004